MLFNQDMTAYRARPAKTYDKFEYYKNGGADEIISVFHGGGTVETLFGNLPYRAEVYIIIPRVIIYRLVPDKVEEEDDLILASAPPLLHKHAEGVRIPCEHDDVDAHDVLFYFRGNYGCRRGIERGSHSLHQPGIPDGHQPGTIKAS